MSTLKTVTILHPSSAVNNIVNDASGNVAVGNNLTVAGTATVGGVAAVAVAPSTSGNVLTSNGTAWTSAAPSSGGLPTPSAIGQIPFSTNGTTYAATQKIVQGTAVASTSGTSIDFTSIPSWVKRVTVMFSGLSSNGSSNFLVQLGTSGGFVSSGYLGTGMIIGSAGVATANFTTGFGINQNSQGAAYVGNGMMTICLLGSNTWTAMGVIGESDTNRGQITGASVPLGGTLTQVRITTVNGTDTFDAGSINILYE
jgi:hypothetical protein